MRATRGARREDNHRARRLRRAWGRGFGHRGAGLGSQGVSGRGEKSVVAAEKSAGGARTARIARPRRVQVAACRKAQRVPTERCGPRIRLDDLPAPAWRPDPELI